MSRWMTPEVWACSRASAMQLIQRQAWSADRCPLMRQSASEPPSTDRRVLQPCDTPGLRQKRVCGTDHRPLRNLDGDDSLKILVESPPDLSKTPRGNQLIEPISTGKHPWRAGLIERIIGGIIALIIVKLLVEPGNPLECGDLTGKGLCEPRMFLAKNLSRRVLPLLV